MKKVFVNGYGSIGRRIIQFIKDDPEIEVIGVGKYSPDSKVNDAIEKGFKVYVPEKNQNAFSNFTISGNIESALDESDLVIDASPGGQGFKNKKLFYEPRDILSIYQGGETIDGENAVSNLLFNSKVNYVDAIGKKHVMQGSCNVTGMGRILQPMRKHFGSSIKRFDVTLVRRWADLEQTDESITDTIELTQNPHHGEDVKSYFGKDAPLFVRAIKVPTRQMHLHIMDVRFNGNTPSVDELHTIFKDEYGVATLWSAKGTKDIRDYAEKLDFSFKDTNMIHIHANMTQKIDDTIQIMYSDDQTGIVIPENHMLLQAMLFEKSYNDALKHTEKLFNMSEKKRLLESNFSKI
ncbi:MAG: type II glyceraldehyde-3-phosphate dehydrogenase [Candidatus Nitrosopelagicus sp.]|nr:type II glyceraldehyde-3-phosphate dehydrogenase [Candidatus Nitrosopelagicus sp.]